MSGLEQAIEKAEFENECRDGTQSNLADDAEGIKEAAHVSQPVERVVDGSCVALRVGTDLDPNGSQHAEA